MTIFDLCMQQGQFTARAVNKALHEFAAEMGGWANLPKKFTLKVPAMDELEKKIEQAIIDGNLRATQDLCDQYQERFKSYLNGWRKKVVKGATA